MIADKIFKENCIDIMDNGVWNTGQDVRSKWSDGTPAYTVSKFPIVNTYDLSKEFPILTLRKTFLKSCIDELLWIWQKKSNNVNDLNSHIWDQWADESGSIGKAYGYQIGQKYIHHKEVSMSTDEMDKLLDEYPSTEIHRCKDGHYDIMMDQIDSVIYDLKNNPNSRRIMTNIYTHSDLHEMNLYPCAYSVTFGVKDGKLNAILNQRSQDMLVANNWNVVQYSILIHMLASVSGLEVGTLTHVIADAHIYNRHIPIVSILTNAPGSTKEFKLSMNKKDNFYDYKVDDFWVEDYCWNDDSAYSQFLVNGRIEVAI